MFTPVTILCARYLIFLLPLPACYYYLKGERVVFWRALLSAVIALAISETIKYVFFVPRPFVDGGFVPLLGGAEGSSFPSSHTAAGVALAVSYLYRNSKLGYVSFAAALLVGVCRVAAGVHYPLDILVGALLGSLVALFVHHLVIYYKK